MLFGSARMNRLLSLIAPGLIAVLLTIPAIGLLAHIPSDDNDSISDNFVSVAIGHPENAGFKLLLLAAILLSSLFIARSIQWWNLKAESRHSLIYAIEDTGNIRAPPVARAHFSYLQAN